jgi:hypothetical protein
MAHISSLTAAMFSDLSVNPTASSDAAWNALATEADYNGKFAGTGANTLVSISHLKEFPALGTPANITKVPEYGSKTSKQVQGQADLPNMEITLNYIPSLWAGNELRNEAASNAATGVKVGDGKLYIFRFALLGTDPVAGLTSANLATIENSCFYFLGKMEALEVTSSLTEAMTAKLTISVQSEIKGAYTN